MPIARPGRRSYSTGRACATDTKKNGSARRTISPPSARTPPRKGLRWPRSRWLQQGRAIEAGRLDQAEMLYREIVRVDPGHVDALHLLGVAAHQRAGHHAAPVDQEVIAKGGSFPLYYSNLGRAFAAWAGCRRRSTPFAKRCLAPAFAGGRYNLAMAIEATGNVAEAVAEYREVLRCEPGFVRALNNLGALLASRGELQEAADCYAEAVAHQPQSAAFHYNLAKLFRDSAA